MKFLISLSLFLIPCLGFSQIPSSFHQQGEKVYVHAKSGLNMRISAEVNAEKVGTISYGDSLRILGISYQQTITVEDYGGYPIRDTWYQVDHNGKTGFVFGGYLSRFPTPDPTQATYVDAYLLQAFTPVDTLVFKRFSYEESSQAPCHTTVIYQEGVSKTFDGCPEKCSWVRYIWEDTDLASIAAIMVAIYEANSEEYSIRFDTDTQAILIAQDLCEVKISKLSAGGVMLEIFCCC